MNFFCRMKQLGLFSLSLVTMLSSFALSAQDRQETKDPEKAEQEFLESIDKEVARLSALLDLEYWQEFYVDSTLNHDLRALQDEIKPLVDSKVSNTDIFQDVYDKWFEKIYLSYQGIFNEDQWSRYLKSGAAREKKNRDKRRAKRESTGN